MIERGPSSTVPDPRSERRAHRDYELWFTAAAAQVEFLLTKTFERTDDVEVYSDGIKRRPADRGTAYDFKLRGLTPGYLGDRNAVKFTAAPGVGVFVCIRVTSV